MRHPEALGIGSALHKLGSAPGNFAARDRAMSEHVAQPVAELVAKRGYRLVGSPAMRAVIAAILDKRDRRIGGAEGMVVGTVDRIDRVDWWVLRASSV